MFLLKQILPAVITAVLVAVAVGGLSVRLRRRFAGGEWVNNLLAACAVGLGYAGGHLMVTGWMGFPPADTTNWLFYFALAAGMLGMVYSAWAPAAWIGLPGFAVFAVGALRLLLQPKFQYSWEHGQGWIWVMGLAVLMTLVGAMLDLLGQRCRPTPWAWPVCLLLMCGGAFGALMLSGSLLLGQLASVLAAAVGGNLVVTASWRQSSSSSRGVVPVFSLLLSALLISGYFFAELPGWSALLLAFAPVPVLFPTGNLTPRRAFALRTTLLCLPVLAALILAWRASPSLDY
ncbi:MAG: hypothetical protein JO295_11955 [Verrucomicrobia bacterium]|nr:hypothetical protein [Verrucomicrobiota bacterium]